MSDHEDFSGVEVAVLGAGPAGTAVACGLARLGYSVDLYGCSTRNATEGVSQRVVAQLQSLNLDSAVRSIGVYAPRHRDWAGEVSVHAGEHLLDRTRFDRALREDAIAAGVEVITHPAIDRVQKGERWLIRTRAGLRGYAAVVDARGRRLRGNVVRGPALLAVSQRFDLDQVGDPETGIVSMAHSWCWYAADGQGHMDVLIVGSPMRFGSRVAMQAWLSVPESLPDRLARRLVGAHAVGSQRARAASACLRRPAETSGSLYAGDAAMAFDPLSGHGIYEALLAAHTNIAAIHTYLQRGQWAVVQQFLSERAADIWQRKMAAAVSFYNDVARRSAPGFWSATAASYSELTAPAAIDREEYHHVDTRPVLNAQRIELRRVLVTPNRPRGVWCVDRVDIASLLDCLGAGNLDIAQISARMDQPPTSVQNALSWLCAEGATMRCGASGFQLAESLLREARKS